MFPSIHDKSENIGEAELLHEIYLIDHTDTSKDKYIDLGEKNGHVGEYGGFCKCPSGKVYPVGVDIVEDTLNMTNNVDGANKTQPGCTVISCIGGVQSMCSTWRDTWSNKFVSCHVDTQKIIKNIRQDKDLKLVGDSDLVSYTVDINSIEIDFNSISIKMAFHVKYISNWLNSEQYPRNARVLADASFCFDTNKYFLPSNNQFSESVQGNLVNIDNNIYLIGRKICTKGCAICWTLKTKDAEQESTKKGGLDFQFAPKTHQSEDSSSPLIDVGLSPKLEFLAPLENYSQGIYVQKIDEIIIGLIPIKYTVDGVEKQLDLFFFMKSYDKWLLKGIFVGNTPHGHGVIIARSEIDKATISITFA
jgi:hypothetical protein